MRRIAIVFAFLLSFGLSAVEAQISRLGEGIQYKAEILGTAGKGDNAPFWFTNNRYGLGTTELNSGLLRASLLRDVEEDSLRNWRIGYGIDLVGAVNYNSNFVLQQVYADFQYKAIRLSVGQKERPLELKNQRLSSGGLTTGINARPLPQIRLELPDFWVIPRTKNWLALKAHIAYGAYTDNRWQRSFTEGTEFIRTANSFYHSKAGFLRIGNLEKFPVTLTGGIEMSCQFAGEAWNLQDRADHEGAEEFDPHQKLNGGIKSFWHALIPSGNDVNDGDYSNVEGNHLGSWHLRADFLHKGWGASFYAEHFFEDHSQLAPFLYDWKDMLYGVEMRFPKNPIVSAIVYEHLRTTYQSGPVYHDKTTEMPDRIAGVDDYYNHQVYGGWQHAGFAMGNPLLISPIYNADGKIIFRDNRVRANHFGIEGKPLSELGYRVLFTHTKSLGTYHTPRTNPVKGRFLLVEASYTPRWAEGLSFTASYGQNRGSLLGSSKGGMLSVAYSGWIKKK